MAEFKRINPSEVPGVYRKLGITPIKGRWLYVGAKPTIETIEDIKDGECLACLCGVLASDKRPFDELKAEMKYRDVPGYELLGVRAGLDTSYAAGLSDGWEGRGYQMGWGDSGCEEYETGVKDGRASVKACELAGLEIKEY